MEVGYLACHAAPHKLSGGGGSGKRGRSIHCRRNGVIVDDILTRPYPGCAICRIFARRRALAQVLDCVLSTNRADRNGLQGMRATFRPGRGRTAISLALAGLQGYWRTRRIGIFAITRALSATLPALQPYGCARL